MIAFLVGAALGGVYFGGLYFSIRKMNEVKHPALLMVVSFFLRMGVLVAVFYFVAKRGYKDMLFTLIGVIIVRFIITFTLKEPTPKSIKRGD